MSASFNPGARSRRMNQLYVPLLGLTRVPMGPSPGAARFAKRLLTEDRRMRRETAFTMEASGIKFGPGVTRELGHDMRQLDARRVMVVTDPYLSGKEPVLRVLEALRASDIEALLFDQIGRAHV